MREQLRLRATANCKLWMGCAVLHQQQNRTACATAPPPLTLRSGTCYRHRPLGVLAQRRMGGEGEAQCSVVRHAQQHMQHGSSLQLVKQRGTPTLAVCVGGGGSGTYLGLARWLIANSILGWEAGLRLHTMQQHFATYSCAEVHSLERL